LQIPSIIDHPVIDDLSAAAALTPNRNNLRTTSCTGTTASPARARRHRRARTRLAGGGDTTAMARTGARRKTTPEATGTRTQQQGKGRQ